MEYHGELFGKIGRRYVPLRLASKDVDRLEKEVEELKGWKDSAMTVLAEWDKVWEQLGRPGIAGENKSEASLKAAEELKTEINALECALADEEAAHQETLERNN